MTLDPEAVERAARACVQFLANDDASTTSWDDANEAQRDMMRSFAQIMLAAALGDKYVIVDRLDAIRAQLALGNLQAMNVAKQRGASLHPRVAALKATASPLARDGGAK